MSSGRRRNDACSDQPDGTKKSARYQGTCLNNWRTP
nr:MAG TPA: hypothetical protein [Caudoviricetes sp.]